MKDTREKRGFKSSKKLLKKAKDLKMKHSRLLGMKKMNTISLVLLVFILRVIRLLRLSKCHDIYTSTYYQFSEAIKGNYKELHRKGVYIEYFCKDALNDIIKAKIDIFKLDREFVRQRVLDAELSYLKAEFLIKNTSITKTRYDIQRQKLEEALQKQETKKETDINEVINLISKYLNKPVNPKEIKTFEVFQILKNIKEDVDNQRRRSTK